MKQKTGKIVALLPLAMILSLPLTAGAQWSAAVFEPVWVTPGDDYIAQNALALDDQGTLHAIYSQYTGGIYLLYYHHKYCGGSWSQPEPIGNPNIWVEDPYLTVHQPTGNPHIVFVQRSRLFLGRAPQGTWTYTQLATPSIDEAYLPAIAVADNGIAHVAFIARVGADRRLAYGYWDGANFTFQIILHSPSIPYYAEQAPEICLKSNGSVAISFSSGTLHVFENEVLGGTIWNDYLISAPPPYGSPYGNSIKSDPDDNLHLTYDAMYVPGEPDHRVFYTWKQAGSASWAPSVMVSPVSIPGAGPKLVVDSSGDCHLVYNMVLGMIAGGHIYYSNNVSGFWSTTSLIGYQTYSPSFVLDASGSGSIVCEKYVGILHQDIYYYGSVEPVSPPDVSLVMTPINPPIQIPPEGGSFGFTVEIHNNQPDTIVADFWTMALTPQQNLLGPFVDLQNLTLAPTQSHVETLTQYVPPNAPAGDYLYLGRAGYALASIAETDTFVITKLGMPDGGLDMGTWTYSRADYACDPSIQPAWKEVSLLASPNPFNPSTDIRYQIPDARNVNLRIYDSAGRLVETVVEGWREAGKHRVIFNASGLPSGIYFAMLTSGELTTVQKMVLMK